MLGLLLSSFLMGTGSQGGAIAAQGIWDRFFKDHPEEAKTASKAFVQLLQAILNVVGQSVQVTGEADEATETALKAYQLRRGLDPDAIVGTETRRALIADLLRVADERAKK